MIIHLVDDDETILDATAFLLLSLNLPIKTWQNSVEFIEQTDLHQKGVLLLDIRMPYLDGQQVHQKLREAQSTLAVAELKLQAVENGLEIAIEDNGGGFSPAQLEFPFVPFRTDKPHGLGLGLVLCQRLMQSLNGQIVLANGEKGARVSLFIPLA